MSMAVTMEWVAKKALPVIAIVLPIVLGIALTFIPEEISVEPAPPKILSCFEPISASIRVTTKNSCPADFISLGDSPLSESVTATGETDAVHPLLASRFEAARIAAEQAGITLYITSGFRSKERQGQLFADAIRKYGGESEAAKWVLPSQFSHHPQGLALDVNYPGDRDGAKWLELNGAKFGLCRVYANEWWHFEGVIAPGQACPPMAPNALVDLE